eukprot:TRINITY_DN2968_c0_g1_i2.p1 TRINITY_DN2968_c0_g1~~TRINITY_DN2968_c0_g1_i2.p1  ORF type:complete len:284 (-),score=29.20 TRINITY_DN2968_c0_g1_i2:516-1367(-)
MRHLKSSRAKGCTCLQALISGVVGWYYTSCSLGSSRSPKLLPSVISLSSILKAPSCGLHTSHQTSSNSSAVRLLPCSHILTWSGMLCIDPKTRLTIDLIKQSKWWRTGLPTEVEASPFAVEVMEDGEEMHMQPELHRLPTVQQVAEPNPGMSGEPNFHEVHEDMEVDEVKYRSLSFTNSTESENTPSADYLTAVCKVDACPQSRYDRLQLEAAKLRCSGNPACVRKLEEEMATLYSRAALGRLSSRLESASPEKVLVCDDEEDEMRHSAISRTTADFGATKAR